MARDKRRRGGPQPSVPGFRPGKEPPRLRKERAKQQFRDVSPTQERLIELFAERTPEQSRALIRRWLTWTLIGAIALTILGVVVATWSIIAGAIVLILAAALLALWWRLRKQRPELETLADTVSGGGGGGGTGSGKRRK